jgi:hypothetical protein
MPAWERESGELPSPIWSLFDRKVGQGLYVWCETPPSAGENNSEEPSPDCPVSLRGGVFKSR